VENFKTCVISHMDFLRSSVDRGSSKVIDVDRNMGRSSRIKEEI